MFALKPISSRRLSQKHLPQGSAWNMLKEDVPKFGGIALLGRTPEQWAAVMGSVRLQLAIMAAGRRLA